MAIVPSTLEAWRKLAEDTSKVITSGQTVLVQRKTGEPYLLQGAIEIVPSAGGMLTGVGTGIGDIMSLFQVRMHYYDGTLSRYCDLRLQGSNSPQNRDGKELEQILVGQEGVVADGLVGGNYRSIRGFVVNYIRIPAVEAVILGRKVVQIQLGVAVP